VARNLNFKLALFDTAWWSAPQSSRI